MISTYEKHQLLRVMEVRADGDTIYSKPDKAPQYKRGLNFLYQFVAISIRYPREAKKQGIEGQVYVSFVIDEQGNVREVQAINGIGYGCDEEAERVLSEATNWIPGEVDGKRVKVYLVLPVIFKLS